MTASSEGTDEAVNTDSATVENLESWQLTLAEWKQRRDELRELGDEGALRAIGGLGTDHAHRVRLETALQQGKPVPQKVLADYPDLAQQ